MKPEKVPKTIKVGSKLNFGVEVNNKIKNAKGINYHSLIKRDLIDGNIKGMKIKEHIDLKSIPDFDAKYWKPVDKRIPTVLHATKMSIKELQLLGIPEDYGLMFNNVVWRMKDQLPNYSLMNNLSFKGKLVYAQQNVNATISKGVKLVDKNIHNISDKVVNIGSKVKPNKIWSPKKTQKYLMVTNNAKATQKVSPVIQMKGGKFQGLKMFSYGMLAYALLDMIYDVKFDKGFELKPVISDGYAPALAINNDGTGRITLWGTIFSMDIHWGPQSKQNYIDWTLPFGIKMGRTYL